MTRQSELFCGQPPPTTQHVCHPCCGPSVWSVQSFDLLACQRQSVFPLTCVMSRSLSVVTQSMQSMLSALVHAVSLSTHLLYQVRIGKVSASAGGNNATESWLPSRAVGYTDVRSDKFKILLVEFAAHSDMRRRMPLGFWLLVGVLHTVSSFSFVESASVLVLCSGGAVVH